MKIEINSETRSFINDVFNKVKQLDTGRYSDAYSAAQISTNIPNTHLKHIQSILMDVEGVKSGRYGDSWSTTFQMEKAYTNASFAKIVEKIVDDGLDSVSNQISTLAYEKISRYLKRVANANPMNDDDINKAFMKFDGTKEVRRCWRGINVTYVGNSKNDKYKSLDVQHKDGWKNEIETFMGEIFLTYFGSVMKVSFNGEVLDIVLDENTVSDFDFSNLCEKVVGLFCNPWKPMVKKPNAALNNKPMSLSALRNYKMREDDNTRFWNTLNNLVANAKECDWHRLVVSNEEGDSLEIDFREADSWNRKCEVNLWKGWSVRGKYVGENDIANFTKFKELFTKKLCELKKVA